MLEFFLLGRFTVSRDGQAVTRWGGRQTRDLVKVLAVERGRPVSVDQLADVLWDEPAEHPERDVKVLVSRARAALGDVDHSVIRTVGGGYLLDASAWFDAAEMERMASQAISWLRAGRPAIAEASFRRALELYRGPLLAEDRYADWLEQPRLRYERLRLDATLGLAGILYGRRDPEAIALAETLLADDPCSDVAVQAVMLARAGCGDPAAALQAYARFAERLDQELGASPAPETGAIHAALLRGEVPDAWPRGELPSRSRPQTALPPLAGRDAELRMLEGKLEEAAAGQAGLVLVCGQAGVGKTTLLAALGQLAEGRCWVLKAEAREREQHLPFQVFAELVRRLPSEVGVEQVRQAFAGFEDVLAELVPELGRVVQPRQVHDSQQIRRRRTLEAFAHLVRSLADARPALLLIDDAHWADPSTLDAIAFGLPRLTGAGVLVLLTARTGEPRAADVAELATQAGGTTIELGPLTPADARRLTGGLPPELAEQVIAASEGIPFYLVQFVRHPLAASAGLPEGLRDAIQERVAHLPSDERRLVEAAAVLGDGATVEALAALLDIPVARAVDALERLTGKRLLAVGRAAATIQFSHALTQMAVYEGIAVARRRLLHGRAADLGVGGDPARVAFHSLRAGRAEQASRFFQAAGEAALASLATHEAERLFQAALDAAREAQRSAVDEVAILDWIGRARSARGDYQLAAEAHQAALSLAPDEAAAARQKVRLGWIAYNQHEPERAAALASSAALASDRRLRSEAFLLQARVAHATGRVQRSADLLNEACQLVGPETFSEVRLLQVILANHQARFAQAVLHFEGAQDELRREGLLRSTATLMLHGAIAMAARGDYTRALATLERSAQQCRAAGSDFLQSRVPNTIGAIWRELGQPVRAAELACESLELARSGNYPEALAHAHVNLAELALDANDAGEARRRLDEARPFAEDPLTFYSWRIRMRWRLAAGRLALLEGRVTDAWSSAETVLEEAQAFTSPKYRVLALLLRAQTDAKAGAPDAMKAVRLAEQLESPPLLLRAAGIARSCVAGAARERCERLVSDAAQSIAAALPQSDRRTLLVHVEGAIG